MTALLVGIPHARAHIEQRSATDRPVQRSVTDELVRTMVLFCEPLGDAEVAQRLGPGTTRRQVDYRWRLLRDLLDLGSRGYDHGRLRLYRRLLGVDPCFCGWLPDRQAVSGVAA